jgi:hypothetical protein
MFAFPWTAEGLPACERPVTELSVGVLNIAAFPAVSGFWLAIPASPLDSPNVNGESMDPITPVTALAPFALAVARAALACSAAIAAFWASM